MKKILILLLFVVLAPISIYAKNYNAVELFKEGNEKYKKGKYTDAIKFYESILNKNIKNGYLYYNLGNAYFKANNLGRSVLNYERAKIYLWSDPDLAFNIKFVNSRIVDKMQEQYNPFTKIVLYFYNLFKINSLFLLSYLLFLILICSLISKWFYKNYSFQIINRKVFNYAGIIFLFFAFILIIKVSRVRSIEYAVILTPEIQVKSGPSEDYTDIFILHEGTKIKIRKETSPWILISLPNGFSGWIKRSNLEKI